MSLRNGSLNAAMMMRNHFDYANARFEKKFQALHDPSIRGSKVMHYANKIASAR